MFANPTKTYQAPTQIAEDTFLIHDHNGEGVAPVMVPLNSLVIRGAEPTIVDTGVADNRDQYLADVFSLVDPEDIRWVFISHDDIDHTGNLTALMDAAPNATLVINWFIMERMGSTLEVPPFRWKWVSDGESFDAGDRTFHAVRPPVFDSPTTRGLYDSKTGFYWASDSFVCPMLEVSATVDPIDPGFWREGMAMFHQYVSPWYAMLDDAKFQRAVDRVENLGVTAIAGCHTPGIQGGRVATAFEQIRTFASMTVPAEPGQEVLDAMLAGMMAPAA